MIRLNIDYTSPFVEKKEIAEIAPEVLSKAKMLLEKSGAGKDFLGWLDLPEHKDSACMHRIKELAQKMKGQIEVLVVIGIGGSYLGTRAVVEALQPPFAALRQGEFPEIVYAGHHLDGHYLSGLLQMLETKDYAVVVISKSGTTTEPAIAFRLLRNHLLKKYGEKKARERIIAITDQNKGALRTAVNNLGYESFYIPDNVGGRFSVLTPVGLLPVAMAGYAIADLMEGAAAMRERLLAEMTGIEKNPALLYVAVRNILYRKGKKIEVMVNYQPDLYYFTEWWKQLFGESEGKEGKGIFPAGVSFTTDLHSLGQYLQEGQRLFFETVLHIQKPKSELVIPGDTEDLDGLNYLKDRTLHFVNEKAEEGTAQAHSDGGVPVMRFDIPEINAYYLGQLIYMFEFACGVSAYLLGVNPFDQPGVEMYKKNMFRLLGKPGF